MEYEEIKDWYEENKEASYIIICIAFIAIGVGADYLLDRLFNSETLRGVVTIIASITGLFLSYHATMVERARRAEYEAYTASVELADRESAIEERDKATAKVNVLQESANTLGDECDRLRASEQTLLQKTQTLKADLQTLEDEKQTLEDKLANAQTLQANAVANAKADALNPYRPYITAGENYLLYAVAKAVSNHNSSYSDADKAKAGEQAKALKSSLDAFRDEHRVKAEKVILS